ncbi:3-oxoacid CoA-transferase subunit B [Deinococcus maricopensis]|uniref:3-oxoacid CoA-transferase, B subunit n=1 Tax=Deinococcus maricopensis (strain DSM 21211 / LMG 22137 / NRRL B-23946 / LB-34) TaxID=709986 RepID=E8UB51_DEIML|nr:3-oxoacid CoA-transferase subunit B [Deinococcus maricopensis]ADV68290.1 3-oxoacid CoA-transferase, B subunit [Deinococcus maricopensis DSM 21211]
MTQATAQASTTAPTMGTRDVIAARAARELREHDIVNLGIGIPALVPRYLNGLNVFLHSENGVLGFGETPTPDEVDPDLVNAGKQPVSMRDGCAFFDSSASFGMIRGGHVDACVIGALQVSASGDIANWAVPGKAVLGVGGAMDLCAGARRVIVTMTHTERDGTPKIVPALTLPATAFGVVERIVTELAVFRVEAGALVLVELQPGATLEQVQARTGAPFTVRPD